jgi:hypothetical protein
MGMVGEVDFPEGRETAHFGNGEGLFGFLTLKGYFEIPSPFWRSKLEPRPAPIVQPERLLPWAFGRNVAEEVRQSDIAAGAQEPGNGIGATAAAAVADDGETRGGEI